MALSVATAQRGPGFVALTIGMGADADAEAEIGCLDPEEEGNLILLPLPFRLFGRTWRSSRGDAGLEGRFFSLICIGAGFSHVPGANVGRITG
jgi:hypothetical protein